MENYSYRNTVGNLISNYRCKSNIDHFKISFCIYIFSINYFDIEKYQLIDQYIEKSYIASYSLDPQSNLRTY